jgi:hypothetical protein
MNGWESACTCIHAQGLLNQEPKNNGLPVAKSTHCPRQRTKLLEWLEHACRACTWQLHRACRPAWDRACHARAYGCASTTTQLPFLTLSLLVYNPPLKNFLSQVPHLENHRQVGASQEGLRASHTRGTLPHNQPLPGPLLEGLSRQGGAQQGEAACITHQRVPPSQSTRLFSRLNISKVGPGQRGCCAHRASCSASSMTMVVGLAGLSV